MLVVTLGVVVWAALILAIVAVMSGLSQRNRVRLPDRPLDDLELMRLRTAWTQAEVAVQRRGTSDRRDEHHGRSVEAQDHSGDARTQAS